MNSSDRSISISTILGVSVTLLGGLMLSQASTSSLSVCLATGVLLMGFFATVVSIFNRPLTEMGSATIDAGAQMDFLNRQAKATHTNSSTQGMSLQDRAAPYVGELNECFMRWHERHDAQDDIWPDFDRWTRDTLNQFIGARRVRCFRVSDSGQQLASLTNQLGDVFWTGTPIPSLIDHVVSTGRTYLRGWATNGELVDRLAMEWANGANDAGSSSAVSRPPDWLVPIRDNGRIVGLLVVGELDDGTVHEQSMLQAIATSFELFWLHVRQADALATARKTDRASGLLNRIDLTCLAEKVLQESVAEGEPVVVLALSIEGVRRLDDEGLWELRDWLMHQIGVQMQRKLRSDDLIGRFSDDRFVAVLRRLDISLGQLIAKKLLEAVQSNMISQPIVHTTVKLRCGLVEGANEAFESALTRAFQALQQARSNQQEIVLAASHDSKPVLVEAGATA